MRGLRGSRHVRSATALLMAGALLVLGGCAGAAATAGPTSPAKAEGQRATGEPAQLAGVGTPRQGMGAGSGTVVRTEYGSVRGTIRDGVRAFRAIPYAAPPVGELRWRNPRPPAKWQGVRDATKPAPACAQQPGEVPDGSTAEDCLYLNVTTPASQGDEPKPVIVWLHGGGFYMGTGGNYDAGRMATRGDAIVVTVNYRLGVFGLFGHPGLRGSGAFGLADQQAALRWVQRSIDAFGGDPDNVTLAGQSAGAVSTCAQLTSPSAAGLFDKAIMQSGSCSVSWLDGFDFPGQQEGPILQTRASVERRGERTAGELGCDASGSAATLACLRALPAEQLMPVHQRFINPAYGNAVLPVKPSAALRAGWFHRVPVLTGQTRNESTQTTAYYDDGKPMSDASYRTAMTRAFGGDEAAVRAEYPRSEYDSAALAWSAIVTDRKWTCTQLDTSRSLASRVPVHHYEFADPAPPPMSPAPPPMPMGAQHASELWSLFDLGGIPAPLDPAQRVLSQRMIDYWTNFAATGDPDTAGAPAWPAFEAGTGKPHVQALAPGDGGIGPVDLAADHHCGFWSRLDS